MFSFPISVDSRESGNDDTRLSCDIHGAVSMKRYEGYPVGSGSVEKAVDIVINRRVRCRRGMRWWRDNADSVVALRTLMLNDDWDILWSHNHHHP